MGKTDELRPRRQVTTNAPYDLWQQDCSRNDFPLAHPPLLYGEPKGLKIVLEERGLWQPGLRLECKDQKNNSCKDGKACYARNVMASQPDFKAQCCLLEELLIERGHLSIFYPTFHYELNYIENFRAVVKQRTRDNCDYTFSGLCNAVPRVLANVLVVEIRRYAWRVFRYMDAYRTRLTGKAAEVVVKKYCSHRQISHATLENID
jgi:hypothetical protein